MRILVVEDEVRLAQTLEDILSEQKYTVDLSYDGESGLDNAMSGIYDAIILDVMMPRLSGYEVVRRMRREGNDTPVLMLTAKTETVDQVTGLDCGAEYYLTKPFETEELLACLRSLLRRQGTVVQDELSFGNLVLDLSTGYLHCGEKQVRLSSKEFDVMRILLANGERIVPKETLLTRVWGFESGAGDNHVEVYISFLRKKLSHLRAGVRIEAVRRMGYHLEAQA